MALPADPVLIPPASTSEASLRIQESIPGASAKGHVAITIPAADLVPQMFGGERPKELVSWEFGSVDVTAFCEGLEKNRDGTLKRPGRESDSDSFADPMLYDDYTHVDRPDDHVVFTQYRGIPHFGTTGPRPVEPKPTPEEENSAYAQGLIKAMEKRYGDEYITDEQLLAEFEERAGVKIGKAQPGVLPGKPERDETGYPKPINPEDFVRDHPRREPYQPMKSGVWIATLENEDDIKALHPDPALDEGGHLVVDEELAAFRKKAEAKGYESVVGAFKAGLSEADTKEAEKQIEAHNFQTYIKDFYTNLKGADTPWAKDPLERAIEKKLEPLTQRLNHIEGLIKLLLEGKTL